MERTALYHVVRAHFRLEDDWLFCEPLNRRINTRSKELASLTPLVMEAYDLGDPVALDICERAAQELWQHIETTARKMGFADGAYRASYSGGVFKAEERILAPLRALAKGHADLRPPRFAPELGAVLLAMRADGIQRDFDGFSFTEQA